jgi:MATE family multidrug resistance protein
MDQELQELEFAKSPNRAILRLAWPICVSMLSYSTMSIVDAAFVGHLGKSQLAGVGLATTISFAVLVFGFGVLQGIKVLVSQADGARQTGRIPAIMAAGIWFALGLGGLALLLQELLVSLLPLISASDAAAEHAGAYLSVRALAAPLTFLFWANKESSYALGDSRSPMVSSVIANLSNIALDYLFIVQLDAGVAGAGWATFVAAGLEAGIVVALRGTVAFRHLRAGLRWVAPLFRVGAPLGLQFAVEVGAFTLMTIIISAMSEEEMAAHQIALNVAKFGFLPLAAVADAASVLAGRAVGADRDDLVWKISTAGARIGAAYGALFSLLLVVAGSSVARIFNSDPVVIASAVGLLFIAAGFLTADGANMVARCVLRGTGDVSTPALIAVSLSWALTPPLSWLLGMQAGMGAAGCWLGITAEIFASAAILWWRLWRGHWKPAAAASRALVTSR